MPETMLAPLLIIAGIALLILCWRFPRLYRVLRRVWLLVWWLLLLPFRLLGLVARPLGRGAAVRSGKPAMRWGHSWESDLTRNPWGNPWR